MTDPVVRRLPPLPVYGSPPLDDAPAGARVSAVEGPAGVWAPGVVTVDLPLILPEEGIHTVDLLPTPAPPQPATAEQAAEIIRLLTDIRDQLARAFGPGR